MNWIRRTIVAAFIAIGSAANWVAGLAARYEGATFSTSRSIIPGAVRGARFDANASTRTELVRKSRYFERNNAIVNKMVDVFECYTVGCGLQLSPATSEVEFNEAAKEWWEGWCHFPDLTSLQSFGTLQGLIARTWYIDGEVFIKLTRGESGRPRVQLIEGHRVATPPELAHLEGKKIIDGIIIDENGRPVGYYIGNEDEKGRLVFDQGITPADSVIHLFEPSRPGQYRGLPFLYPVINEIHDLDDLHIFEMKAAKDAAEITNVIKTKTGEMKSTRTMIHEKASQGVKTNTGATASEDKHSFYQPQVGGRTVVMQRNDDIQQFKSERPSVAMQWYWRYKTELVCAGGGISYVLVFPESMQGTVYRGALDMADAFFRSRSAVLQSVFRRIYEWVMLWATANESKLRDKPGDWKAVSVHPPRAVNVDVGRNSSAMLAELEAGATNYELVYAPLGLDWRESFRKLAEQKNYAASLGLQLGTAKQAAAPAKPAKKDEDEGDDDIPDPKKKEGVET